MRRERSLREASEGFADETRFLDEGGRVGSDDIVRLRGGGPGGRRGRIGKDCSGAGAMPVVAGEPDARLFRRAGTASSDDPPVTLAQARARLAQDLNLVVRRALESTQVMLRRFGAESP